MSDVEITTNDSRQVPRREDFFDGLLRWVHRLLNPRHPSSAPAPDGRRQRRVRDRVPI
ncbi:MAG TPA: hypothetical protein VEO37_11130 [Thermoanaerobaculia bacterium]|nr:hypothetical protein [Thermoanaerobaculia bacterium]